MYVSTRKFSIAVLLLLTVWFSASTLHAANEEDTSYNEFLDMDISELMQITITSVSKKPEPLADAAAAVFVIRHEDIQRSGVTTIQDALKLVPGVHIARIGSDKWAVGTRGFNGRFSNKLLVLMDGRTLYSPAFGGVYWEMQGTLLEDIDRIEVIRGPGATLWGANAVNGVINIITKKAADTHGGLIRVGAGTEEKAQTGLRYGGTIQKNIDARAYFTYDKRDSFELFRDGSNAQDDWDALRLGFRIDGNTAQKTEWTIQGDVYENTIDQLISPYWISEPPYQTELRDEFEGSGWNILGKLQHTLNDNSVLSFQAYYDSTKREEILLGQEHGTFDAELQYQKKLDRRNNITAGLGYRLVETEFANTFQVHILPDNSHDTTFSGFIQDAISLIPDTLTLTLGTKWEHNDYTGSELQPSGRILWKVKDDISIWGAISRAVRVPTLVDDRSSIVLQVDPTLPPFPAIFTITGSSAFESEEVIAYEVGYRWFPDETLSVDITTFYNDYEMLQDSTPNPLNAYDSLLINGASGYSWGAEAAITWKPLEWAKFDLAYSFITVDASSDVLGSSIQVHVYENSAPTHILSLFSQFNINPKWDINLWLRYVDEIEASSLTAHSLGIAIDDYLEADISINYQVTDSLKLTLVGQNLLNSSKLEFISEAFTAPTEVERGVYLKALWTF